MFGILGWVELRVGLARESKVSKTAPGFEDELWLAAFSEMENKGEARCMFW